MAHAMASSHYVVLSGGESMNLLCPWCGSVITDPDDYEWGNREGLTAECGECGNEFVLSRRIDVSYRAEKPKAHR